MHACYLLLNNACDVWHCLRCYSECASTLGKLKSLLDTAVRMEPETFGITNPMLYQLSYLGAGSIPTKGRGFDSHRGQANFSPRLVWMHTQSNIVNIIFTNTHKKCHILEYIDIERTRLICEISPTRTDLTSSLSWQSIGLASKRSQVRFPPWSAKLFSLPGVDAHSE